MGAAPYIWARSVSSPVLGADGLGCGTQRAQIERRTVGYWPRNMGVRFSTNALAASLWSSVCPVRM